MENNINENQAAESKVEEKAQNLKTSLGMEENLECLLCYLFGWVTGLIFLLTEKNSKTVKFHAVQSLILGVAVTAIYFIFDKLFLYSFWYLWTIISLITGLLSIGYLILSIFLMIKAYKQEICKLPVIGDFAEKAANK